MERNERTWIIAWAALLGFSLLILHNWVLSLSQPGAYFGIICPLYVSALILPLSLQMLSGYRTEKLSWLMSAGFTLVMAGCAAYIGDNAWIDGVLDFYYSTWSFLLAFGVFICWFILMPFAEHQLSRHSWCDDYTLLFSATWRNLAKLVSAAAFNGLFWALLMLWAGLFKVLNFTFFLDLFTNRHFVYPVTAMAFGIGLSLYSAREDALVGIYRTSLTVLGWLLPLVTFIQLLFLLTLLFKGLEPLWNTGYATTLMLTLLGLMVFLFNAAWQDASGVQRFPNWLLQLISLGFVVMPVYIVLCAYALGLRITQYGWSIERIWAALAVLVLSVYAFGYAATSLRRQTNWMQGAKSVNICGSLLLVSVLILTATPVLDPARISVNSQIQRLLNAQIAVEHFDFNYLRFNTGKYGNTALKSLLDYTSHPQAELMHSLVAATLKKQHAWDSADSRLPKRNHAALAEKIKLYPKLAVLDPAFVTFLVESLNQQQFVLGCESNEKTCYVLSIDLNADAQDELIVFDAYNSKVFSRETGEWRLIGNLRGDMAKLSGAALAQLLEEQSAKIVPRKWSDIRIGNNQYAITEMQK